MVRLHRALGHARQLRRLIAVIQVDVERNTYLYQNHKRRLPMTIGKTIDFHLAGIRAFLDGQTDLTSDVVKGPGGR